MAVDELARLLRAEDSGIQHESAATLTWLAIEARSAIPAMHALVIDTAVELRCGFKSVARCSTVIQTVASYSRMQAPQMSQIRANAASSGNSLFQALDQSGDGRLSLREMRTAHGRIKSFDNNKDHRITQDEIPITVSVTFGVGYAGYSCRRTAQGARPGANRRPDGGAPEWFTRMDRNGDGDVTLKEFLGDAKQFKKFDTNGDGFIEPKEAKAVAADKE